ncbi:MAG: hypothetical protein ABIU54_13280 [Candidatus Eisenbacteria bacterium]
MTRGRLIMALAAAFLVGSSVGVLGGIVFARFVLLPHHAMFAQQGDPFLGPHRGPLPAAHRRPGPGGAFLPGGPERHLARLSRALGLSAPQRQRLVAVMERSHGEFDGVRDSLEARIARELTPAQRERWKQMQRQFNGAGERRGPWPHSDRAGPGEEGEPR